MEIFVGIAAVLLGAGVVTFLLLTGLNIVLFLKLRSMFDRGVPFAGY